jgi:hypothetical protein
MKTVYDSTITISCDAACFSSAPSAPATRWRGCFSQWVLRCSAL